MAIHFVIPDAEEDRRQKTAEVDDLAEELVNDIMGSIEPKFAAMTNEERTELVDNIERINSRASGVAAH